VQKPCTEPEPTATAVSSPTNTATAVTTPTQTATAVETPFAGWETFVVESRRQTAQLPKQMYAILPNDVKRKWSFYSCWTKAPPTKNAVLFAAYGGFAESAYSDPKQKDEIARRHQETRDCMESAFKANPNQKIKISFVIGDSPTPGFVQKLIANDLQPKQDAVTKKYGQQSVPIGFGYDELAVTSMAYALGNVNAEVIISNPEARMHYEGSEQAQMLIGLKLAEIGVTNKPGSELKILVLTRRPGADNIDFQSNDTAQRDFDAKFLAQHAVNATTAIVDARLYNGAWDSRAIPKTCDYLAFGGWGTFGNSFGSTVAIAKILYATKAPSKQYLLEAVAHDVFFQGYEEAQRAGLKTRIEALGIQYQHYHEYTNAEMARITPVVNTWVNQRMREHFDGTDCMIGKQIDLQPQRNMLFEGLSNLR
jgi:hypothetical protein